MFSLLCPKLKLQLLPSKVIPINNTSVRIVILKTLSNQDRKTDHDRRNQKWLPRMDQLDLTRWIHHWEIGKRKTLMRNKNITLIKNQILEERKVIKSKRLKFTRMTVQLSIFLRKLKMMNSESMIYRNSLINLRKLKSSYFKSWRSKTRITSPDTLNQQGTQWLRCIKLVPVRMACSQSKRSSEKECSRDCGEFSLLKCSNTMNFTKSLEAKVCKSETNLKT